MKESPRFRCCCVVACLALVWVLSAVPASAQTTAHSAETAAYTGDFFIISSVDLTKKELLLKVPTEVTELIRANDATRYFEKNGKAIKLSDLRAGDTVYITLSHASDSASTPVAATIRKGPMTVDELRRRYLQGEH